LNIRFNWQVYVINWSFLIRPPIIMATAVVDHARVGSRSREEASEESARARARGRERIRVPQITGRPRESLYQLRLNPTLDPESRDTRHSSALRSVSRVPARGSWRGRGREIKDPREWRIRRILQIFNSPPPRSPTAPGRLPPMAQRPSITLSRARAD